MWKLNISGILNKGKDTEQAPASKKGKRMSGSVNKPQPDRVRMQMDSLRTAVEEANDTLNPSWINLHLIYRNVITDAQYRTQRQIAVNKLKASPFIIEVDGTENEDLTKLFKRPWFSSFLEHYFDAEMWGYSIIEFGQQDEHSEFLGCKTFPRTNVYPFNRNIIVEATDTVGIDIGDKPEQYFLFEIGETDGIGLLELISREVVWKAFARRDWSELSEKWGQPRIILKTEAEGEELDSREAAARNFAHNGYMIMDIDDEIDKIEASNSGSGYQVFDKNIRLCDEQISKLVNGQTGSSDEKAFVGAAEVHERILNDYHSSRLRDLTNLINFRLFNFLRFHGYVIPDNAEIRYPELEAKTDKEKEDSKNPEDSNAEDSKKKSPVDKFQTPWT